MKLTLTSCSNLFSCSLLYVKLVSPGSYRWASCVALQKRFEDPYLPSSSAAKLISGRNNAMDLDMSEDSSYGSVDHMEARDQPFRSGSSANLGEPFTESASRGGEDSVLVSPRRAISDFLEKGRRDGPDGPREFSLPDSDENHSRENSQSAPGEPPDLAPPSDTILSYLGHLQSKPITSVERFNHQSFKLMPDPVKGVTDGQKFYPIMGESPILTRLRSLKSFFHHIGSKRKRESVLPTSQNSRDSQSDVVAEASPMHPADTELLGMSPSPHSQPLGADYVSPFQSSGYSNKIETVPAFYPSAGRSNSDATFNHHQAGGEKTPFRYEPWFKTPSGDPSRTPPGVVRPLNTSPQISMRVSPKVWIPPPSVGDPTSTSPRFISSSPINFPSSSTKSSDQSEWSFERMKGIRASGFESLDSPTSRLASPDERTSTFSPFITPASSSHFSRTSVESSHDSKLALESIEDFLFSDDDYLDSLHSYPASASHRPHHLNIMHDSEKLEPSTLLENPLGWQEEAFKNHETHLSTWQPSPVSGIPFADEPESPPVLNDAKNVIQGSLSRLETKPKSAGEYPVSSRWEWHTAPGLGKPATSKGSSLHNQFTGHRNPSLTHSNTPTSIPTDLLATSVQSSYEPKEPRQDLGNTVLSERKKYSESNPYFRLPF